MTSSLNITTPSANATPTHTLSTPSPDAFPLCLSSKCCRQRGLRPQWPCEVCRHTELSIAPKLTLQTARPATALMPFRAGSVAFLSSSSSNNATTMKSPAIIPGNPGTPPPMKQARREVPLPSQEGKKGVMQYALYVWPH